MDTKKMLLTIVAQPDVQRKIIALVQSQLQKGKDGQGKLLSSFKPYSPSYAAFKGSNLVDLKLTGDFYASFRVDNYYGGFEVKANDIHNLNETYGGKTLDLSDESKKEFVEYIKPLIKDYVVQEYSRIAAKSIRRNK